MRRRCEWENCQQNIQAREMQKPLECTYVGQPVGRHLVGIRGLCFAGLSLVVVVAVCRPFAMVFQNAACERAGSFSFSGRRQAMSVRPDACAENLQVAAQQHADATPDASPHPQFKSHHPRVRVACNRLRLCTAALQTQLRAI